MTLSNIRWRSSNENPETGIVAIIAEYAIVDGEAMDMDRPHIVCLADYSPDPPGKEYKWTFWGHEHNQEHEFWWMDLSFAEEHPTLPIDSPMLSVVKGNEWCAFCGEWTDHKSGRHIKDE